MNETVVSKVVGELETNCYLLTDQDSGECALVDPGDEAELLTEWLRGKSPRYILLTHGHFDHVGALPAMHALFPDAAVVLHELDADGTGFHVVPVRQQIDKLYFCTDKELLPFGSSGIRVYHTPGHTRGSVVYHCGDTLLTGDTLFAGSCGRSDFPGGDSDALYASLHRISGLDGKIYPGHGVSSDMAQERENNVFLRYAMRRG